MDNLKNLFQKQKRSSSTDGISGEDRVVQAARVFISKSEHSVDSKNITDLFEAVNAAEFTNRTCSVLIQDRFIVNFVERIRLVTRSGWSVACPEVPRLLNETVFLLLKKSLTLSSQVHQELESQGLWSVLPRLIDICPVEHAAELADIVKEIALLLHQSYGGNMNFAPQLLCVNVFHDLIHLTKESRGQEDRDRMHLNVLHNILSIYNREPDLCFGMEPNVKFISHFVALLPETILPELRIMIFKSMEVLATALDFFHKEAFADIGMIMVDMLRQLSSSPKLRLAPKDRNRAFQILGQYRSLLEHLVEYNNENFAEMRQLSILENVVLPLLTLPWELGDGEDRALLALYEEQLLGETFGILHVFLGDNDTLRILHSDICMSSFRNFIMRRDNETKKYKFRTPESLDLILNFFSSMCCKSNQALEMCTKLILDAMSQAAEAKRVESLFQRSLLKCVRTVMKTTIRGRSVFRLYYGFESCIAILSMSAERFLGEESDEALSSLAGVIESVLSTFTEAMEGPNAANRQYVRDKIGYRSLSLALKSSGVFESKFVSIVLDALFRMFSGINVVPSHGHSIFSNVSLVDKAGESAVDARSGLSIFQKSKCAMQINCASLRCILYSLVHVRPWPMSKRLLKSVNAGLFEAGSLGYEMVASVGAVSWALEALDELAKAGVDGHEELRKEIITLLRRTAKQGLRVYELRYLLRLLNKECERCLFNPALRNESVCPAELGLLLALSRSQKDESPPFLTFGQTASDEKPAYGVVTNFGGWTWPPQEGISFSCWLKISSYDEDAGQEICLIEVHDGQQNTVFGIYLGKEGITFGTGPKGHEDTAYFRHDTNLISFKQWHHFTLVHKRTRKTRAPLSLFGSKEGSVHLYVDGRKAAEPQALPFTSAVQKGGKVGILYAVIGNENQGNIVWHLGPTLLTLEAFSPSLALRLFLAGPQCRTGFRSTTDTAQAQDTFAGLLRIFQEYGKPCEEIMKELDLPVSNSIECARNISKIQHLTLNTETLQFFFTASQSRRVDMSQPDGNGVVQSFVVSNMAIDSYGVRQSNPVLQLKGSAFPTTRQPLINAVTGAGGISTLFHLIDTLITSENKGVVEEILSAVLGFVSNICKGIYGASAFKDLTFHNGYAILAFLLKEISDRALLTKRVLLSLFDLCTGSLKHDGLVSHTELFRCLLLNTSVYLNPEQYPETRSSVLECILQLVRHPGRGIDADGPGAYGPANPHASYNVARLRELGLVPWVLTTAFRDAQSIFQKRNCKTFPVVQDILFELLCEKGEIQDIYSIVDFLIASLKYNSHASSALYGRDSAVENNINRFQQTLLHVLLSILEYKESEAPESNGSFTNGSSQQRYQRLLQIYKLAFFERQPVAFLCILDMTPFSTTASLALKLFIQIIQSAEGSRNHLSDTLLAMFEDALCNHSDCVPIYALLIAFITGIPVSQLPMEWFNESFKYDSFDTIVIMNGLKNASGANEVVVNSLDEKTINALMRLLKSMLTENIRKSTFSDLNEVLEENSSDCSSSGKISVSTMVASVFMELVNERNDFVKHFGSSDFTAHLVEVIFCCASRNVATMLREKSDKSLLDWSLSLHEDYLTLDNEESLKRNISDEEYKSPLPSSRSSLNDDFIDESIMSGDVADILFKVLGKINEDFILGTVSNLLEAEVGEGCRVCLGIMSAFPPYASPEHVRTFQIRLLQVLRLNLGQTLRSLRFDWLHNTVFDGNVTSLCENILSKSIEGWYAGSEDLVLAFLFDCLSCMQGLSGVTKLDLKRREAMLHSVLYSVYSFACFAINECNLQIQSGNGRAYEKVLVGLLNTIVDNSRWLFVIEVSDIPRSSSGIIARQVSNTSADVLKRMVQRKSMLQTFSACDFINCISYLTKDYFLAHWNSAVSFATLKVWKAFFEYCRVEMMNMFECPGLKDGERPRSNDTPSKATDLYADGFYVVLQDGEAEAFFAWYRDSYKQIYEVLDRKAHRAWKRREKSFSSSTMSLDRLVEMNQLEKIKKMKIADSKTVNNNTGRAEIPSLCKIAVSETAKDLGKNNIDLVAEWNNIIDSGRRSWKLYKLNVINSRYPLARKEPAQDHWQLDLSECYSRMRLKLKRNHFFHKNYGLKEQIITSEDRNRLSTDAGRKSIDPCTPKKPQTRRFPSLSNDSEETEPSPYTRGISAVAAIPNAARRSLGVRVVDDDGIVCDDPAEVSDEDESTEPDYYDEMRKVLIRPSKFDMSDEADKILFTINCKVVRGLEAIDGIFALTGDAVHIVEGYQKDEFGKLVEVVKEITKWEYSVSLLSCKPAKEKTSNKGPGKNKRNQYTVTKAEPVYHRIDYKSVKGYYLRRYLLRRVGLELYNIDGGSVFIALENPKVQAIVHKKISSLDLPNCDFVKKTENVDADAEKETTGPKSDSARHRHAYMSSMMNKWLSGEISNFQYLMILNTFAGRSYNDLTQYPVFPWVLADYESDTIDLSSPSSFRDLSKPMGALSPKRAKEFLRRYEDVKGLNDPLLSPFHYGTHYSTSAYILYYFVRLEPFSQMSADLQNGKFDHPTRLFSSIAKSWIAASGQSAGSLQDVRELTPEFFYSAEFLKNSNRFDFGALNDGKEPVDDVVLPPWCDNDPEQFIRLNRKALESKYVSENLHHWIDLIFGYKQTGAEAEAAQNVFHPFTYEGEVDIDAIEDQVQKDSIMSQIHAFGQTPNRLFTKPHPAKRVSVVSLIDSEDTALKAMRWHRHLSGSLVLPGVCPAQVALKYSKIEEDSIIQKASKALQSFLTNNINLGPVSDVRMFSGKNVMFVRAMNDGIAGSSSLSQMAKYGAILHPPTYKKYLTWGHPDGSVQIHTQIPTPRHREIGKVVATHDSLHSGTVSCAAFSDDGRILVTGGEDASAAIWHVAKLSKKDRGRKVAGGGAVDVTTGGSRSLQLKGRLCGHERAVMCVAICTTNGIVVTGSKDCSAIIWDLSEVILVRFLEGHESPVHTTSINRKSGNIVTVSLGNIRIWTVNGLLLASVLVNRLELSLISTALSTTCEMWQDGIDVVTGHEDGKVALWRLQHQSDERILGRRRSESDSSTEDSQKLKEKAMAVRQAQSTRNTSSQGSSGGGNTYYKNLYEVLRAEDKSRKKSLDLSDAQRRGYLRRHKVSVDSIRSVLTMEAIKEQFEDGNKQGVIPKWYLVLDSVFDSHDSRVTVIRLSEDQSQMVTGDGSGQILWWDSVLKKAMEDNEILTPLQDMF
jgi:WD40 repeat protein